MSIPQHFISDLLDRADIVELVGRSVQLKKAGANYQGLCPFHSEKSPSFTVSPTKQFFHCFGCGKNGNAIGFLMEHAGMNFVEAVQDLAGQYGMSVPEDHVSPQERAELALQKQAQNTLFEVLEQANAAYQAQLRLHAQAVDYLKLRGLTGHIAKRFGLGYAPAGQHALASVFPHYEDPLLEESGLVIAAQDDGAAKRHDRFRDRIMFPIRNLKGQCIGFGGRVLGDAKPKYLNSPETPVFSKGRELYGLFEAKQAIRDAGYALVTEGYMDVVALAQWGFAHAVATLGTACTFDHVQKLLRHTDSIVFAFDGDAAGRRAARKALDICLPFATDVRNIRFLFLPPEHDPDSFIRDKGAALFEEAVRDALPLSEFLLQAAQSDCDLLSAEGRSRLSTQARQLWWPLPDGALKRQLLAELGKRIGLDTADLVEIWTQAGSKHQRMPSTAERRAPGFEAGSRPKFEGRGARSLSTPTSNPRWERVSAARAPRKLPFKREDHVLRVLLADMALLDALTAEDHQLLGSLPEVHAQLLRWLESTWHDQGALPWGTVLELLPSPALQALADKLMKHHQAGATQTSQEGLAELRQLLGRMLQEDLQQQMTQAIANAAHDTEALKTYQALQKRLATLRGANLP
jgi:DNA primase